MTSIVRLLGSRPVAAAGRTLTARRLRVLAYHGVDDERTFAAHLDHLRRRYVCVTGSEVADSIDGGPPLPRHAVWITFDDGDPTVVSTALPLLAERGLHATLVVCPGLLGTTTPFWWDTVAAAERHGVLLDSDGLDTDGIGSTAAAAVATLKRRADDDRRSTVHRLAERLATADPSPPQPQLTDDDLTAWLAAGNEIGNHTWDHPCLDRCSPDVQRTQVASAHDALAERLGVAPTLFAWPNGDPAPAALATARSLGYRLVLTFDHRLCRRVIDPLAVSRLRIDADADLPRFRSIVSGAHSAVFHLARRVGDTGRG